MIFRRLVASTVFAICSGAVTASAELPPAPAMPAVGAALAKRASAVEATLANIDARCASLGMRNPRPQDRRCSGWIASVEKGGEAAAVALAQRVVRGPSDHRFPFSWASDPIRALGHNGSPRAVVALLTRLRAAAEDPQASDPQFAPLLAALGASTGIDLVDFMLYGSPEDGRAWREAAATTWLEWYAANAHKSREEWRAAGIERARERASSTNVLAAHVAIRRLAEIPAHRAFARDALIAALSRPTLAGDDVWMLESLAPLTELDGAAVEAAAEARRNPFAVQQQAVPES